MSPAVLLITLPSAGALAWQAYVVLRGAEFGPPRLAALVAAALLMAWSWWRRQTPAALPLRVAMAAAAPFLLWISVLEYMVRHRPPMALGFMAVLTAAALHGTIALAALRPPGGNSTAAKVLLRLGVFACALAIALTGSEAVLRLVVPLNLYAPQPDDPSAGSCLVQDAHGRYVAVPGFRGRFVHPQFAGVRVEINDWGLRDGLDEATPPAPGALSILVLGDSFIFGTGVALEDTLQERLEARAAEFTAQPVRVYNGGIPGYGTIHERLRLDELADRTRPDVVVTALFEDNDFQDNWSALPTLGGDDTSHDSATVAAADLGRQAHARQRTLGYFLDSARSFIYWGSTSALAQFTQIEVRLLDLGLINPVVHTNLFLNICLMRDPPPEVDQFRNAVFEQLDLIHKRCDQLGAKMVVLVIPSVIQVDPRRFESFLAQQVDAGRDHFARTTFHRDLVRRLNERGFTVVDTLPALEAATTAGHECYHREGHWNARGNAVAADQLVPVLKKLLQR